MPTPTHHIDPTHPEPVRRFLAAGARLESIRLDEDGVWWHEGARFENPKLIRLFSRSITRTEGGTWVLTIPPFTYPIEVDDTPVFVDSFQTHDDHISLSLSDQTTEPLDISTLEYIDGRGLYCTVHNNTTRARFKRSPYYTITTELFELSDDGHITLVFGQRRETLQFTL